MTAVCVYMSVCVWHKPMPSTFHCLSLLYIIPLHNTAEIKRKNVRFIFGTFFACKFHAKNYAIKSLLSSAVQFMPLTNFTMHLTIFFYCTCSCYYMPRSINTNIWIWIWTWSHEWHTHTQMHTLFTFVLEFDAEN